MKLATILSLVAATLALPTDIKHVAARASYSKTDGLKFNIDGVTKYYAGTNSYWIPFLTNDNDVNLIMGHLASSKHKILRVWGFNDVKSVPGSGTVYFQSFSGSSATINTGANGLRRLDAVVAAAEKNGIKLIINFLTSTAVFAWELANEPRCNGCATSVLTNWIRSSSNYVRSLDSDHMIAIGDEGFGLTGDGSYPYQLGEGLDFAVNLALPNVSFGTFHLYPSSWGTTNDWGNRWISDHASVCKQLGKPCMFEEYGVTTAADHCPVESKWQTASVGLRDAGMAADLFWQLGDTIQSTGSLTHNDGNTIYYNSADWTCLVTNHLKRIG
ncbi:glycoside hydrolase superfamily [Ampelomyces quisqualis]|uniref:mannan endo-1,4-beta-mannosidase n=1 Tax=Ampelomyces quisqualis TaxID=50730 RepID=A0A6A5QU90_AMPQU|nr:glycoside hydrolase superfamily [Ampelomyces quisqualis]